MYDTTKLFTNYKFVWHSFGFRYCEFAWVCDWGYSFFYFFFFLSSLQLSEIFFPSLSFGNCELLLYQNGQIMFRFDEWRNKRFSTYYWWTFGLKGRNRCDIPISSRFLSFLQLFFPSIIFCTISNGKYMKQSWTSAQLSGSRIFIHWNCFKRWKLDDVRQILYLVIFVPVSSLFLQ